MFGSQVQNSWKQSVLSCSYCRHKFRALQGLIAHKHKHERAGDNILPKAKLSAHSYTRNCTNPLPPAGLYGCHY